jgi:hypothetical protein
LDSQIITKIQVKDLLVSTQVMLKPPEADDDNQLKHQLLVALELRVTLAIEDDK